MSSRHCASSRRSMTSLRSTPPTWRRSAITDRRARPSAAGSSRREGRDRGLGLQAAVTALLDDGRPRCGWALGSEAMIEYHDEVWGVPQRDAHTLFEFLVLEGAQAGLSWSTILNKRSGYQRAFAGFDPATVARFGPDDVERLMQDASIVRNRLKITSTIDNAKAWLGARRSGRVPLGIRRRGAAAEWLRRNVRAARRARPPPTG